MEHDVFLPDRYTQNGQPDVKSMYLLNMFSFTDDFSGCLFVYLSKQNLMQLKSPKNF